MSSRVRAQKRSFKSYMDRNLGVVPQGAADLVFIVIGFKKEENSEKTMPLNAVLMYIGENDVDIPYKIKRVKNTNNEYEDCAGSNIDEEGNETMKIVRNKTYWVTTFDQIDHEKIETPALVNASITASVYKGRGQLRFTNFRSSFRVDTYHAFKKYVHNTPLSQFPILKNFNENEKTKTAIIPIYPNNEFFRSTDLCIDYSTTDRMKYISGTKKTESIGFNLVDATMTMNIFAVDICGEEESCFMKVSYGKDLFNVFGVVCLDAWMKVAPVIVSNVQYGFLTVSASRERQEKLIANISGEAEKDSNGNPKYASQVYATSLNINLYETIKASGLPIGGDYAGKVLKEHKYKSSMLIHPINHEFDERIGAATDADPLVLNVSEIPPLQRPTFYEAIEGHVVEYWGIFGYQDSSVDDLTATDETTIQTVEDRGAKPAVIFAVVKSKTPGM